MNKKLKIRYYGNKPYKLVVVHGGPGAPGSVSDIAENLSIEAGTLEPMQTEQTLKGQIEELRLQIIENSDAPVILFGHSWGAFLSFFVTVNYPELVEKLVLISSGPFDSAYVDEIYTRRVRNYTPDEARRFDELLYELEHGAGDKNSLLNELGQMVDKSDNFDTFDKTFDKHIAVEGDTFSKVWYEAAKIRSTGKLLSMAELISCPVICIHGDYDPHPYEGVVEPLKDKVADFSCYIFENCGHYPWREKAGRQRFYQVLKQIVNDQNICDQDEQKAGE